MGGGGGGGRNGEGGSHGLDERLGRLSPGQAGPPRWPRDQPALHQRIKPKRTDELQGDSLPTVETRERRGPDCLSRTPSANRKENSDVLLFVRPVETRGSTSRDIR